jgi:hypothetical protein
VYGTGDGNALQSAADASCTNAHLGAVWFTPGKIYINDHAMQTVAPGTYAQIWFPNVASGFVQHPNIHWTTEATPGMEFIFQNPQAASSFVGGSIIWSVGTTMPGGTNQYNNFYFGNPIYPDYVNVTFDYLQFMHPYDQNAKGLNFYRVWNMELNSVALGDGEAQAQSMYYPQVGTNGISIVCPNAYNDCSILLNNVQVLNDYDGIDVNGNVTMYRPDIQACEHAISTTDGDAQLTFINAQFNEDHYFFDMTHAHYPLWIKGTASAVNVELHKYTTNSVQLVHTNFYPSNPVIGDIELYAGNANVPTFSNAIPVTDTSGYTAVRQSILSFTGVRVYGGISTTSNGVVDLGTISAKSFTGGGSGLTNINSIYTTNTTYTIAPSGLTAALALFAVQTNQVITTRTP